MSEDVDHATILATETNEAALVFARRCGELQARYGQAGDTLDEAMFNLVSWLIDYGFSKKTIVTALKRAAKSRELKMEGRLALLPGQRN